MLKEKIELLNTYLDMIIALVKGVFRCCFARGTQHHYRRITVLFTFEIVRGHEVCGCAPQLAGVPTALLTSPISTKH